MKLPLRIGRITEEGFIADVIDAEGNKIFGMFAECDLKRDRSKDNEIAEEIIRRINEYEKLIEETDELTEDRDFWMDYAEKLVKDKEELIAQTRELTHFIKRNILMKMYPAKCTDEIQVFETREEYMKVLRLIFSIDKEVK